MEVYQHSSAAWLEDQDFFRFSGIFRSVFLYAKPAANVDDLWLQTTLLEDNTTGKLTDTFAASFDDYGKSPKVAR